ncbi:ABC transporter ATP-binding protein [Neotabrizicola sp. sgz301269]|uniref:ABC transporter ATP-binding protein n=1 Tax=Neotabrizicola sp. sgz301269 TaxID=3276282 RepID=UPI00376FF513
MPDQTHGPAAVELRSVVKRFGTMTAIDRLDLTIRQGEFFTLLGASGCGKTTTLRLIAGFDLPSEGQILISGQDVSEIPAYQRPVHTVFQSYALFPHLTIRENVAFPLRIKGVKKAEQRERAQAALDMVQMSRFGDRKPSQLSGGQQQRVALARALVNEPKVLLLDEPLGALDLKLRKEMQLELKAIQKRLGITFVFVTHDQEEALTMSDRIALMAGGRIVQLDSPTGLYNAPQSLYAAEFIGETNLFKGRVAATGPNGTEVETLGRRLMLPPSPVPVGIEVTLALRPERIRRDGTADGPEARLHEVDFIGTDQRLVYALADGTRMVLRQQNCGGAIPAPGEITRLVFDPADIRLFQN